MYGASIVKVDTTTISDILYHAFYPANNLYPILSYPLPFIFRYKRKINKPNHRIYTCYNKNILKIHKFEHLQNEPVHSKYYIVRGGYTIRLTNR